MAKKEKVKPEKPSTKKVVPVERTDLTQENSKIKTAPETATPPKKEEMPFHVVGIGASAGGLDAFESFFTNSSVVCFLRKADRV
jgi:chemotaxis response regulator CheB